VRARALAALALARQLDAERSLRDEVLIAIALDHSRHAAELAASRLPAQDPFAALALGDSAALARLNVASGTPETRALQGLALAHSSLNPDGPLLRTREMRQGLDTAAAAFAGPWVDRELYHDFQRAAWLSGLYRYGRFYTRELGDVSRAVELAAFLARVDDEDTRVLQR